MSQVSNNGSPLTCRDQRQTSRKSKTGPLLTRSSSGSIGIGEPPWTASSIPPEVCSPKKQLGKHANTKPSRSIQTFHTCAETSPAEKVPLHEGDVNWFQISLAAWQWKAEAPSPKWETLSKARFWLAMGHTSPKHGASLHLDRLRARLSSPLMEVKSTESGKVDVVNIEVNGKMVKIVCVRTKMRKILLSFWRRWTPT